MTTDLNRLMRLEERQSDLRVKVAGLEAASAHQTSWIEAHRARATSIEQRQARIEQGHTALDNQMRRAMWEIGRLDHALSHVSSQVSYMVGRISRVPPAKIERFQLPVAVSVLALAVVARWLGLDLSGYLPGAIR